MIQINKKLKVVLTLIAVALSLGYCLDTSSNNDDDQNLIALFALLQSQQNTDNSITTCDDAKDGCYIFLTASKFDGNLGGISGADEKCNADSNKPAVSGRNTTYKAVLNSIDERGIKARASGTNPFETFGDWPIKANQKYIGTDGSELVTSTAQASFIGDDQGSETTMAFNKLIPGAEDGAEFWSGFSGDSLLSGISAVDSALTCRANGTSGLSWRSNTGGDTEYRGNTGKTANFSGTGVFTKSLESNANCNLERHLVCVEQ